LLFISSLLSRVVRYYLLEGGSHPKTATVTVINSIMTGACQGSSSKRKNQTAIKKDSHAVIVTIYLITSFLLSVVVVN